MPSEKTQPADNKQIVNRLMNECWSQGKLNAINELVASNCRFHDPVFPSLTSGADNLRRHIETCRNGYPDLKFSIDDTISERNEVVVHWTATGTHKGQFLGLSPTNKHVSVTGTSIYRIDNGQIAEAWANWNLMSMMEQLGVDRMPQGQTNPSEARTTESKARA